MKIQSNKLHFFSVTVVLIVQLVFGQNVTKPRKGICRENSCGTNATCIPKVNGQVECVCPKGYQGDPKIACFAINECWGDGTICDYGTTCENCCNVSSYWWSKELYACGWEQQCWENGRDCLPNVNCYNCCNGAYDNMGMKCGGSCWEEGRECVYGNTCNLCCDYDSHWVDPFNAACGHFTDCFVDGTPCRRDQSCNQCCNRAYNDNGNTCGGKCMKDGQVCDVESGQCSHVCCNYYSFWLTKNDYACGYEPCYANGTICGDYCYNCCQSAYGGPTCGGECLVDGVPCDINSTCSAGCCNWYSFSEAQNTHVCGQSDCLSDGIECKSKQACWQCCNGPYFGRDTCGGECLADGEKCDYRYGCYDSCCSEADWYNGDHSVCGEKPCLNDGESCIPWSNCYECCNGAYDKGGFQCGGECIADGIECAFGEDCHLCCNGYSLWYSTNKLMCGSQPCLKNGTSCTPRNSCTKCCNGAFANNGKKCGGKCLPDKAECSLFSTCGKCCSESYYWNKDTQKLICGWEPCLKDGTSCRPGDTCYNCCSGQAYNDNGTTCGGQCWEGGTKCNYFSTCNLCCGYYYYSEEIGSYLCEDYYNN